MSKQVGGDHYQLPIEPIDFILANGLGYVEGNVIKYLCRYQHKGNPVQDLEKAKHYLEMLIEHVSSKPVAQATRGPAADATIVDESAEALSASLGEQTAEGFSPYGCRNVFGVGIHAEGCMCTDRRPYDVVLPKRPKDGS